MARALEIKRIDLVVHAFHSPGLRHFSPYDQSEAKQLLEIWKMHIDEAAKDPSMLVLFTPTESQLKWQEHMSRELEEYARKRLGRRFGYFLKTGRRIPFHDNEGKAAGNLENFLRKNCFSVDPKKVKTRGFGEYTNSCVLKYLTGLNQIVGLEDPIPYRNRQSALLVRKSVGADFEPWTLKELMKTPEGRAALKKAGKKYAERRLENANVLLVRLRLERPEYKPRPHLMKKRGK